MKVKTFLLQIGITSTLIAVSCIVIFEIPPRLSPQGKDNSRPQPRIVGKMHCDQLTIKNETFIYGPCPNSSYTTLPGEDAPLMKKTVSCTDSFGGRISCRDFPRQFNSNDFNTFIIGDSFIQSEELTYEKSIAGLINSQGSSTNQAYAFGYSSWNTNQYKQAIKAIAKTDSSYDVYLFVNDLMPSYFRSRIRENDNLAREKTNNNSFVKSILHTLEESESHTLNKVSILLRKLLINVAWVRINQLVDSGICIKGNNVPFIGLINTLTLDYLAYTEEPKCWSDDVKESYDITKSDMLNISELTNKLDSSLRFIFMPPPYSFRNENTGGRIFYNLPPNQILNLEGLRGKLKKEFGETFIDLTPSFQSKLSTLADKCTHDCSNFLYFSYDGHLNESGHILLNEILYKNSD